MSTNITTTKQHLSAIKSLLNMALEECDDWNLKNGYIEQALEELKKAKRANKDASYEVASLTNENEALRNELGA